MFFDWWRKLVRVGSKVSRRERRKAGRPRRANVKPWAEVLEDRTLLSSYAVTDLGTLGGSSSLAYGINDAGQVVGEATTSGGYGHAFLYQNGGMADLGTLGGTYSVANGINDVGQVVGDTYMSDGSTHVFLYQNGGMTDLNDL